MGEVALTLGIVALAFALFPFVGEVVAAPAALAAIVLGVVGVTKVEPVEREMRHSLVGMLLGVTALLLVLVVLAATA